MVPQTLSRRQFGRAVGAAVGAALVVPRLAEALNPRLPTGLPADTIQLNSNENPYGPSAKALEAMTKSQRVASRYPDALETQVVEALARFHGVAPEQVILGCGSSEVLRMAVSAFLSPGKTLVLADPTFEYPIRYAGPTQAEVIKVPLTADFRHDLPRMAQAVDQRTGLVFVCNPNNPTGTIVTRDELAAFLARAPQSATILVDEAYHHFVEDPRYSSAFEWVGKFPNLIVTRTFSKIYAMAGMRLGYAVSTKENIGAMRRHLVYNNSNAAVLEATLASLGDAGHVARHRKLFNDTRRWLCAELDKEGRRYIPSQTNFVMVHVGRDVRPVIEEFRKRKILVGRRFPPLDDWLRVSIGTRKEMEMFVAHLREIVPAGAARAA